jgi:3-hydroxybutyryl-CoA dehydrogenase
MREAGGFRMGPFELMDLIGHDVNFAVTESVFKAYFNDPRFTPSVVQQELVNAGYLGRKSGRGFYTYGDNAAVPPARSEAQQPNPGALVHRGAMNADLLARFEAHGINVSGHENANDDAGQANAFHCQGAQVCLTDGRSATQRAFDSRHADTVVFDLVLDYASAPRIAVARASQCSDIAYHAAVGLFQRAGFTVTRLDDVPGLAVMRTVAMLANEAADAVYQGVCTAQDADTAMRKGVNYPRGPLAWADVVGLGHIVGVLDNLAASYGDGRYRVSPLLRRHVAAGGAFYA